MKRISSRVTIFIVWRVCFFSYRLGMQLSAGNNFLLAQCQNLVFTQTQVVS